MAEGCDTCKYKDEPINGKHCRHCTEYNSCYKPKEERDEQVHRNG